MGGGRLRDGSHRGTSLCHGGGGWVEGGRLSFSNWGGGGEGLGPFSETGEEKEEGRVNPSDF